MEGLMRSPGVGLSGSGLLVGWARLEVRAPGMDWSLPKKEATPGLLRIPGSALF